MTAPAARAQASAAEGRGALRHASYLALGSLAGRLLGLFREITITRLFGQTGLVSAFTVASQLPVMLYDLLIGGYVNAAFIPVLSARYAQRADKDFQALISALLCACGLVLLLAASLLIGLAPVLSRWMAGGFLAHDPALLDVTAQLVRQMAPVLWLTGLAGLLNAVLYAMRRFAWPAAANAVFNLGIVALAPLLARTWGVFALVAGLWAGVGLQVLILAADLRRAGFAWRATLRHPALRDIGWRYLPIVVGLIAAQAQILADRRMASGTGVSSIAWMRTGTTLQQLPLGLITVSAGLATLPLLSRAFDQGRTADYRAQLAQGLTYMALLMTPVLLLMGVLAEPIIRLLFLRGEFTVADVAAVLPAVRIYLVGAFCAALDYLLNNAFYARKNTVLPSLVGLGSVALYFASAAALLAPFNYLGLVWADTLKHAGHMLTMLALVSRYAYGRWYALPRALGPALGKIALAGSLAAAAALGISRGLAARTAPAFWPDAYLVAVSGLAGLALFGAAVYALNVPEAKLAVRGAQNWARRILGRGITA